MAVTTSTPSAPCTDSPIDLAPAGGSIATISDIPFGIAWSSEVVIF
jgi:hypothetical protein